MLVNISVNSLYSGRFQICVSKPQSSPHPVQTYPSAEEARRVLLAFGIEEKAIDEIMNLLSDTGPNEPLYFKPMNVPQDNLWSHGFKP
jgi:hypothetical protein